MTVTPPGGGKAIFAWPAESGRDPRRRGPPRPRTYESWYLGRGAARIGTKVLSRGADDGFDLVVFGLPISCVPYVALDLVASSPRGRGRLTTSGRSPPRRCSSGSSSRSRKLAEVDDGIVVSGYVEPFDTWADMSQLPATGEGERLRHRAPTSATCWPTRRRGAWRRRNTVA